MKHMQTETEKNITIMPPKAEDDSNSKAQSKKLRIAMYCRVNTREQLQDGRDEASETVQKLSMD
ncbi:hypothetical protein [Clostridium sp. FS41]|uniref:hypothetical protein n=1 Tax=Clostridia TaxID=186801 RepID=UPI0005D372F0|nr:hypothetical protein [Clostridium sp. FS41]KJJ68606.1 hypothetical protein CLFS41_46710 [Clostridium sp. FS41]